MQGKGVELPEWARSPEMNLRAAFPGAPDTKIMKEVFVAWATVLLNDRAAEWHSKDVSWMTGDQAIELARWYLWGLEIGYKPLAAGLCSRCGNYVYGDLGSGRATSNRRSGPPRDAESRGAGCDMAIVWQLD